jgi:hypothetical protein
LMRNSSDGFVSRISGLRSFSRSIAVSMSPPCTCAAAPDVKDESARHRTHHCARRRAAARHMTPGCDGTQPQRVPQNEWPCGQLSRPCPGGAHPAAPRARTSPPCPARASRQPRPSASHTQPAPALLRGRERLGQGARDAVVPTHLRAPARVCPVNYPTRPRRETLWPSMTRKFRTRRLRSSFETLVPASRRFLRVAAALTPRTRTRGNPRAGGGGSAPAGGCGVGTTV